MFQKAPSIQFHPRGDAVAWLDWFSSDLQTGQDSWLMNKAASSSSCSCQTAAAGQVADRYLLLKTSICSCDVLFLCQGLQEEKERELSRREG